MPLFFWLTYFSLVFAIRANDHHVMIAFTTGFNEKLQLEDALKCVFGWYCYSPSDVSLPKDFVLTIVKQQDWARLCSSPIQIFGKMDTRLVCIQNYFVVLGFVQKLSRQDEVGRWWVTCLQKVRWYARICSKCPKVSSQGDSWSKEGWIWST